MKKTVIIVDKLGVELAVGDKVAYSSYQNLGLSVGVIESIGRIRAKVALTKVHERDWEEKIGSVESFRGFDLIKL